MLPPSGNGGKATGPEFIGPGGAGWATNYALNTLSILTPAYSAGLGTPDDHLKLRDPEDECEHGRLAGDRTPPCGCFPKEGANNVPRPAPAQSRKKKPTNPGRGTGKGRAA